MLDDRAAIYNLKQTFGSPGTLYVRNQTIASKTGIISGRPIPYRIKCIVKLPRKMLYAVSNIGRDKAFSFIKEQVPFLIDAIDLPTGVTPGMANYIVIGGRGYTVESIMDLTSYFVLQCTKIDGDIPQQIVDRLDKDILTFTDELEVSVT